MSLARTALRLCAVAALKGATNARPTIAEGRIYDSRNDDLSPETYSEDAKPTVIVLTDNDEGEALSRQNGGPPFHRLIDLVLEYGMIEAALDDSNNWIIGYPDTDKRLEASLDLLEFQMLRRLQYELDTLPTLFRTFVRIRKHDCHRQVLDETGVKIACRILTLQCEVNDDQVIIYNKAPDASPAIPTGLDILPDPMRRVAKAMSAGSSELDVCNAIVAALAPIKADPFDGMDATVDNTPGQDTLDMFDISIEVRSALDVVQIVATGPAILIDYSKGAFQNLILSANVTAVSIINWPPTGKTGRLILQITNTGAFGITGWPTGTVWAEGDVPVISSGAGKRDILVLTTADAGADIFGNIVGQDYH